MLRAAMPSATCARTTAKDEGGGRVNSEQLGMRLRLRAFKERRSEAALIQEAVRRLLGIED
jgi:hypothetical protein